MQRTVALLAALDTKSPDADFVRARLQSRGHRVVLVDIGVLTDPAVPPHVTSAEVAEAAGTTLETLRSQADRSAAVEAMSVGAARVVARLHDLREIDGVFALGGGAGTTVGSAAMRDLPLGVPKVLLSTIAAGNTANYLGTSDIVMFPSIVDIAGINRISRRTYARAADAMAGMLDGLEAPGGDPEQHRPLVAATMFGVTTACVLRVQEILGTRGYEVVVFHATGAGGRTMERLIGEKYFDAVLDLTTTECTDEVVGGILTAGPDRMRAAALAAIPQVVSVGATDMVNFGRPDTIPEEFSGRNFYHHNAENTLMRTTEAEAERIGLAIAENLNLAQGPTTVLLPTQGVSALDAPGQQFDDPGARTALADALVKHLANPNVRVESLDMHVNDPEFADAVANCLVSMVTTSTTNE